MSTTTLLAPPSEFIDSTDKSSSLLDELENLPTGPPSPVNPPSLYIDLEGTNLSRHGTISILQLHTTAPEQNRTYLIDIHTLGSAAFQTSNTQGSDEQDPDIQGQSLKRILESAEIPKVIFDVRRDSDALFSLYGIKLAGVQDLQLMENATRTFSKKRLHGLARCIERDARLPPAQIRNWKDVKEAGKNLFDPDRGRGGSYEVFNNRPLAEEVRAYCVMDVVHMPKLWMVYCARLSAYWRQRVLEETDARIAESMKESFSLNGENATLSPFW